MLPANTVWLEPNTTKAPMNNVNFRKAIAYAINPQQLVQVVYSGITEPAGPTGLLPNLKPYVNQGMVNQYGFSYNPSLARQFLAKSGYHGQNITLEVPDGWTDWMAGVQVISQDLAAVGIKVTPTFPQYAARTADLTNGTYDLALDNNASSTPRRGATSSGCTRCRSPSSRRPSSTGSGSARRPTGTWSSRRAARR